MVIKHAPWIAGGAAALAAIALLAWAFTPRAVEVDTAAAVRGHFETRIEEDGKTRLRERYVVSAPLSGTLARLALHEGDAVEAGAPLAAVAPVLSPLLDERSLREQQLRVQVAQAQAQRAAVRVDGAHVTVERAESDARRSAQLARDGFIAPDKLETDRLAAQAARKELEAAVQEQHMAVHEVAQARAALLAVRSPGGAAGRAFTVTSPVSGRVLRILQPSETGVTVGTPLLELGDTRQLEIVAELLTTDALQARPGSPVVIERWGGEGVLQGRVRLVEPGAFTKISALGVEEQRVKVLIDITSPPAQWAALGDGYRVTVGIVTLAVEDALTVPVSAVFPLPQDGEGNGGGAAVFAVRGGRAHLVPVKVAARNESDAWLRDGLAPGTLVVAYPPASVQDGTRVRARER